MRLTDCSIGAAWRATRRSHESYLAEIVAEGKPVPVLLDRVKGLRLDSIMIDVLHTVDQGVASHVIGNIFFECISQRAFGGANQDENASLLQNLMKIYYQQNPTRSKFQGKLEMARIRTSKQWPKLRCKAAATRHLAKFALGLAQQHLDARRVAVCNLLCRFYWLLEAEGQFMSQEAKDELPRVGRIFCQLYTSLSAEAFAANAKRWKMSPKVHLFQHLTEHQAVELGNPKFYWVYCDEDLVGQMIEVAQTCHPTTVCTTAMFKWMLLAFDDA